MALIKIVTLGTPFMGVALAEDIYGTQGADTITANGGNDTISAGAGNDIIDGGAGADRLYGDSGEDHFVFGHSDRIADFEAAGVLGGDIVDLSAVDADTSVAGNQTFVWNSTSQGGMQVVEGVDGVTIVRLYIDGDPEADAMLTIADINFTASVYTALDFIL